MWVVTGASGFLGTNAGFFLSKRTPVVGFARQSHGTGYYTKIINLDLRETVKISTLIKEIRPAVILHGAAIAGHETAANDPKQAYAVNVAATRELAQSAAEIGARLIYISTDALFAGNKGNYSETDPVEPFSIYGETKLEGEIQVRKATDNHVVVRTNFFGWSDTGQKSILEFFLQSLRSNNPTKGYPDFVVTSLYVQDLLETIWELNETGANGTFNVASSDALSKYDFGVTVAETFGLDSSLISPLSSSNAVHSTSRDRNLSLSTDKISATLNRPMSTQQSGVSRAREEEDWLAPLLRAV